MNSFTLQFQIVGGGGGGWVTDKLNIKNGGGARWFENVIGQKWQLIITNYGCPKQNFFAPYLDIVDTGATITSNKISKAN